MRTGATTPLTVENALVRSATIEVRVLSIGKRQVTMSVFRQVPEEEILTEEGDLAGIPWGWVNYWWDGATRWGQSSLHVLWAKDGELRRSCVAKPTRSIDQLSRWNATTLEASAYRLLHLAEMIAGVRAEASVWQAGNREVRFSMPAPGTAKGSLTFGPWRSDTPLAGAILLRKEARGDNEMAIRYRAHRRLFGRMGTTDEVKQVSLDAVEAERRLMEQEAENMMRAEWENLADLSDPAAGERAAEATGQAIDQLMNRWQASYETCKAAGQLFIAT